MSTEQTDRLSELQDLVVDGVPVFHLPGPSRTSASLCFGVGLQHETYETVGVTHLVAGLVAAQMPKAVLEAGVSVEVDHTRFTARGRPEEVAGFLRRVCTALVDLSRADLPLEHLEREKKVLVTEGTASADLTMATCWTARYGYEGLGLASTNGYGPLALTEDDVRAHRARHFTADGAALAVLGPLPDDLSLPLPGGGVASSAPSAPGSRLWPPPRLGDGPEWVQSPAPAVGLLLDGLDRDAGAVVVATGVLRERLQDVAREQRGLTYSVASDLRDGPDGDLLTMRLDFREGRGAEVAALVWEELTALATAGPTQVELDHVLAVLASGHDPADDDAAEGEPFRRALVTAIGARLRTPAELAADVAATTGDDVRDVLARAHRRALLVLPDGEWLPDEAERAAPITERWWCAVEDALPPGRQLKPPVLERVFKKIARRRLVLTEEGIAELDEISTVHEVRWDEVAGLAELPSAPGIVVVGRNLCPIGVHPDVWGRPAFEEVLQRLAPHAERLRRVQRAEGRDQCPG